MLKLKLQYFGHLMRRTDSLEKTLMLGKIEGRRRERQKMTWLMASLTKWTWVWVNSGSWWWTRKPGVLQSMGWQRVRHDWLTELNWILKNVVFGWYRYSVGFFLYFGRLYVFLWYIRNMNYNKLVISLHLPAGSFAQGRSYQVCQEADDANTENKIEMYRYWVKNTHLVHSLV